MIRPSPLFAKKQWKAFGDHLDWIVKNLTENQKKQFGPDIINRLDHIDPGEEAKAFYNRGVAKDDLGDHPGAIADYDKAIELNPDDDAALNNRGLVKSDLGDYQGAIEDLDKAIRLEPDNSHFQNIKAHILLAHGKETDAEYLFTKIFDAVQEKEAKSQERGKKQRLTDRLNSIPEELKFLKKELKPNSPHENLVYLYALLDHAFRNTLCYIAFVCLKCDFEMSKKYLTDYQYNIREFEKTLSNAFAGSKKFKNYPKTEKEDSKTEKKDSKKKENSVADNLGLAITARHKMAHGKQIGKAQTKNISRWEAISGLRKEQCYQYCLYFIEFYVAYLNVFQTEIQAKQPNKKFNPFEASFQGLAQKNMLDKTKTTIMLNSMGLKKTKDKSP